MSKELTANPTRDLQSLMERLPEHREMLTFVAENSVAVQKATDIFYKTQSQFVDTNMTLSFATPMRNIHQALANIQQTRDAIREHRFKYLKQQAQLKIKARAWENEKDDLQKELLEIEMEEIKSGVDHLSGYLSGAIRRLTHYTNQFLSLMKAEGLETLTEEDFEKDEERFHIMTAFNQALMAARSRGGVVDEGNMIYFHQLGINGAHAQYEISRYLSEEAVALKQGKAPTHEMTLGFLDHMAKHFAGSAARNTKLKGLSELTHTALIGGKK